MNKRKIVINLGPAVVRGGKNLGEDGYWAENWMLKLSTKHCQIDRSWRPSPPFQLPTSRHPHQEQGNWLATVVRRRNRW